MKFIVSSSELSSRLQNIGRVIIPKNPVPIYESFLFETEDNTMTITASDGDTTLVTHLELSESDGNARFCINARTIQDSMKEIVEQPLTFDINMDNMEINGTYQNGHFTLMGQNADDYPLLKTDGEEENHTLAIDATHLNAAITRCLVAAADDDLRPQMCGVYFDQKVENLSIVATDGRKLVCETLMNYKADEPLNFILPKKPATLLKNILAKEAADVEIAVNSKRAIITMESATMTCKLVEARYPNYASVIPNNNPFKVTVDRLALLGALKRVYIFADQGISLVKLHLEHNKLVVSAQDFECSFSAEESVACAYDGNDLSIGFKGNYLIDFINNMTSENVYIELADPSRPGIVRPTEQDADDDLLMLLMPIMLNN